MKRIRYRVTRSVFHGRTEWHVTDGEVCVLDHTRKVSRTEALATAKRLNERESAK